MDRSRGLRLKKEMCLYSETVCTYVYEIICMLIKPVYIYDSAYTYWELCIIRITSSWNTINFAQLYYILPSVLKNTIIWSFLVFMKFKLKINDISFMAKRITLIFAITRIYVFKYAKYNCAYIREIIPANFTLYDENAYAMALYFIDTIMRIHHYCQITFKFSLSFST